LPHPFTVVDASDKPVGLGVLSALTAGVGKTRVQLKARRSTDDKTFMYVGRSQPWEVGFTTDMRGIHTVKVAFRLPRIQLRHPGIDRFLLVRDSDELPGQFVDLRVI